VEPDEPTRVEDDQPHLPPPTLWPVGFAIGVAVVLVGLVVNPLVISSIGGAITIVFGFLWIRDATSELRGRPLHVEPERRELRPAGLGDAAPEPAQVGGAAMPPPEPGERFPRNRFLEGATIGLGGVILGESALSFLGFGVPPPYPSWGSMLSGSGRTYMFRAPWMAIWPGIAISLAVLAANLVGDGLRDLLDPSLRGL
jgi:hypothetical protein